MRIHKELQALLDALRAREIPCYVENLGGDIPGIAFPGRNEFIALQYMKAFDHPIFALTTGEDDESQTREYTTEEIIATVQSW